MSEGGKHSFDVIEKHLESLKQINGPVYLNDNAQLPTTPSARYKRLQSRFRS